MAIGYSLYVEDLISGATTVERVKLLKVEATKIFEDAAKKVAFQRGNILYSKLSV